MFLTCHPLNSKTYTRQRLRYGFLCPVYQNNTQNILLYLDSFRLYRMSLFSKESYTTFQFKGRDRERGSDCVCSVKINEVFTLIAWFYIVYTWPLFQFFKIIGQGWRSIIAHSLLLYLAFFSSVYLYIITIYIRQHSYNAIFCAN